MLAILVVAAFLRAHDLALMLDMTHYDEAYYGVDALSLLAQPRLTPFFPENFGRESLFMYVLTPMLGVFGGGALALRLTAFFISLLTVAAVYRLGRELVGRGAGVWAAAVLAVLFWSVLTGHQAFRAHLYPLVAALAFAVLLHAQRKTGRGAWLLTGVLFGVLAYTYIAARAWLAVAALLYIVAFLRGTRSSRRHILLSIAAALLVATPLIMYLVSNPQAADQRSEQVAISTLEQLGENIVSWAGAWLWRGSGDVAYNLPQRPILDPPLLVLLIAVLAGWLLRWRNQSGRASARPYELQGKQKPRFWKLLSMRERGWGEGFFLFLIFAASLAPAILTTDTLKPLRAVGVVVPLALAFGVGIEYNLTPAKTRYLDVSLPLSIAMERRMGGEVLNRWTRFLIIALLALSAIITLRDFGAWVRSPDLYLPMEQHLNRAINTLETDTSATPVYFSPFTPQHPVIRLRAGDLAPRPVSAFTSAECLRLPDAPEADYFALTLFDGDLAARLAPYATVNPLHAEAAAIPRYTIYRAEPNAALFAQPDDAAFDGRIGVRLLAQPTSATRGESLALTLALRAVVPLDHAYTLFAHLYGDPTPYEGGTLWAQTDMPMCISSPPQTWRTDERIIQTATLTLPADVPLNTYDLAIGIYDTLSLLRLPLTDGTGGENYAVVGEVRIEEGN